MSQALTPRLRREGLLNRVCLLVNPHLLQLVGSMRLQKFETRPVLASLGVKLKAGARGLSAFSEQ